MSVYGTVTFAGIEAKVVSDDECELADVVICVRKGTDSPFTDNLEAPCSRCGQTVIFRPYAPRTPPKVCTVCAIDVLAADAAPAVP